MSRSDRDTQEIGTFEVTSGKIVVKDPCYTSGSIFPAKNGTWTGILHTDHGKKRICALEARAPGHHNTMVEVCKEGVDSGQMGVFNESNAEHTHENDYNNICKMTLKAPYGGIIKHYGVASSTAYGDGTYPVMVSRDLKTGEVTSVIIEFTDGEDNDYPDQDDLI